MNSIQQTVFDHLPQHRSSSKGWLSFNAVCCHHRGESQDKRGRGGLLPTPDGGVTWHCFNCGYKTGWSPGWYMGYRFRKFLEWLGVDENERQRLVIEALRIREYTLPSELKDDPEFTIEFTPRSLPENSVPLSCAPDEIQEYAKSRRLPMDSLKWSNTRPGRMYRRIIIPCTWDGQIIGSTARAIDSDTKPKYFNNYDSDYVYGIDCQAKNAQFALVMEGVLDALSIGGIATLTNECSEAQAQIIDTLAREIILVPDRDRAGQSLIDDALEYGWSVSFPDWEADVKDVNAAVVRYGKLFTLKSIIDAKQTSRLKINLMRKRW